jgi:hypothetical protein
LHPPNRVLSSSSDPSDSPSSPQAEEAEDDIADEKEAVENEWVLRKERDLTGIIEEEEEEEEEEQVDGAGEEHDREDCRRVVTFGLMTVTSS